MSSKAGYNDELYYPITESTLTIDIFNHYSQSTNYWIASPGYVNDQAVYAVALSGLIYSSTFQNDHVSVRPVVALKAETVLTSGTDGFDYNLGTN